MTLILVGFFNNGTPKRGINFGDIFFDSGTTTRGIYFGVFFDSRIPTGGIDLSGVFFFLKVGPQHVVIILADFFYSGTPTCGIYFGRVLLTASGTPTRGWRRLDWRNTKPTSGRTTSRRLGTWRQSSRS